MNYDVLIVGTGVGGLYTAINLNENIKVLMITKENVRDCNSYLAQGGVTTILGEDDLESFIDDTLKAGNYKNNLKAVSKIGNNSIKSIKNLTSLGVPFENKNGKLKYTREGGHSKNRIVYCEDQTGKAIVEELIKVVQNKSNITIMENTTLTDLLIEDNRCYGASIISDNRLIKVNTKVVVLATGGIGGLFNSTTNFSSMTGDGLALAIKHNVKLKDMEYLQLHPTVLYEKENKGRRLLLSESLRGEGGVLVNINGESFVDSLLPRDVVSAAVLKEIVKTPDKPYVYLDMTSFTKEYLINRFPYIYEECLNRGLKMESDLLPVAPAHHYCMGGIEVDLYSRTNIEFLYAVGEVSCTGVHGSNRLASNSLLEALVFGENAAENINSKINEININLDKANSFSDSINMKPLIEYVKGKADHRYDKLFNC
ncbi:L-aspartate oxidase [uncultured Clostridium sp.]|uniref:L-aspartate oxidase n=1 Tax=uncultured Clostridium sp. TaxID=59620 RepID=UPI000821E16E|nr:L-aspartate oxidase [uncultured Clostridium sp.]SCJ99767.1 L-aspartate oxidase [uncultured Clostridium sp.]